MPVAASSSNVIAQSRAYYGRTIVAIAALAMVATLPGRTQGLGLITEALLADLQISRVSYAAINLWATLIGALFCLPCGRLLDRTGSRVVMATVTAALGATVLAMSRATGVAAIAVTILLTRGLGQSALSVVSLALVGKWYGKSLNYAMATYSVLVGIGFIAAFPSVGQAVLAFGWRSAWSSVGWTLLIVCAPLMWIVTRDSPEDATREFAVEAASESNAKDITLWGAFRTPAFWIF